jgi:KUP system potassium uptake protein
MKCSFAWHAVWYAGDIGTSPLYVYSTIFSNRQPTQQDVLCATSLIFWSITLVVLLKYVFIVLLADDNGEGGLPRAMPAVLASIAVCGARPQSCASDAAQ